MTIKIGAKLIPAALLLLSACKPSAVPPATRLTGEEIFQRCLTCHSAKNENRPTGPNLHGLLGRKAATREGYFYSQALREASLTWDRATLDAFLTDPQKLVPESFMPWPTPDADERAAVIDYLLVLQ